MMGRISARADLGAGDRGHHVLRQVDGIRGNEEEPGGAPEASQHGLVGEANVGENCCSNITPEMEGIKKEIPFLVD